MLAVTGIRRGTRVLVVALPVVTLLAVAVFAAGCSRLALVNALVPRSDFVRASAIEYGTEPRQKLDVYRPLGATAAPVVLFFYGGRWRSGERGEFLFVAEALTSLGVVVVIPDYRLAPEAVFPAFVEDGARAVEWTYRHAGSYGGDPGRIYLMGHSAGAHIAALLALDRRYLDSLGVPNAAIAGMIGLAGPYDFLPFTGADVRVAMGPPEGWPETQPVRFARRGAPPLLLLHGGSDETVEPRNTTSLAAAERAAGGCVRTALYPKVGHVETLASLWTPLRSLAPVREDIAQFIGEGCSLEEDRARERRPRP
ncbi:MAG: alpha/beta hydrolase [Gemmatimonadota bacterium]